jgi:hypothetical protein
MEKQSDAKGVLVKRRGRVKALIAMLVFVAVFAFMGFRFLTAKDSGGDTKKEKTSSQAEIIVPAIEDEESETMEAQKEHLTTGTAAMPGEGKTIYYDDQ